MNIVFICIEFTCFITIGCCICDYRQYKKLIKRIEKLENKDSE